MTRLSLTRFSTTYGATFAGVESTIPLEGEPQGEPTSKGKLPRPAWRRRRSLRETLTDGARSRVLVRVSA